ncbi:signal transduction histidine kinase [Agromyces sp. 3263]|uniref:sensor histidine kinase n=1 Tax=Agromyces sp. 3263 TaxID=2817750 RepID=UPI002862D31B|nr:histidine kinase [Agromyces sp. 3263]MDR6907533.1 signal transduction histidine kinase [Agromyces sp. 3263]
MTASRPAPDHQDPVAGGELRLPRAPGVARRYWARHPRLVDGLIAGVYGVPTIVITIVSAAQQQLPPGLAVAIAAAALAASLGLLVARRTHPRLVLALAWLACLASIWAPSVDVVAILLALYGLAVYGTSRAAWIGFGTSAAVGAAAAYLSAAIRRAAGVVPLDGDALSAALSFAVLMLLATLIGVTVGNRRRYLDALIARAHDLARERDQQSQLAAAAERARIAREMHDIVSHGLTVMITLAEGSAATAPKDPERAAATMRHVAEAGRDALGEMRRMLGVLEGPTDAAGSADRAPQPGVDAIPALVDGFRDAGLPVRLTTAGAPITEPTLELAVYRLVQEGLTNALRHADGAQQVDVRIVHGDDAVEVVVEDDGHAHGMPGIVGSGRGLPGLRERVGLYGGTLDAGPRSTGGWRMHATLHATLEAAYDRRSTDAAVDAAARTEDPA